MKGVLFVLAVVLSSPVIAGKTTAEKNLEVKQHSDGTYSNALPTGITYHVDTIAQLCFVRQVSQDHSNPVPIPCKNLKRRPEWAAIITWE